MPEKNGIKTVDRDKNGRFIKGNHASPGRPPKEECVTDLLRETVDKQALVNKLIELALNGDKAALTYCIDRLDGKPRETIDQTVRNVPEYVGFIDAGDTEDTYADREQ